ncbi:uncharacterized protein SCODWIG_02197 [Saccharomycodes ludwigii]|uniref:Uncharacterized protein n=1 Tax=Saccharomycodes ludwigii TaxID=36035 RepID=A0A376B6W4_9ASCO|nr:hypothetical protein SCDLUD_003868 [Saccharomycodes ludwigii]KAH3899588.1 hypothetical protein SCDLUD_003868 [Saccharomycodes ludwigii]SSD60436.1 uncharacterized protein SCODWIG_02197 [Saccharomycodes ludwigii]
MEHEISRITDNGLTLTLFKRDSDGFFRPSETIVSLFNARKSTVVDLEQRISTIDWIDPNRMLRIIYEIGYYELFHDLFDSHPNTPTILNEVTDNIKDHMSLKMENAKKPLEDAFFTDSERAKLELFLKKILVPVATQHSPIINPTSDGPSGVEHTGTNTSNEKHFQDIFDEINRTYPHQNLNLNIVIDEQGSTVLHWLCSLANVPLISVILKNAETNTNFITSHTPSNITVDITLGDNLGESSLLKAVKSVNNYENGTFESMLEMLYPCLLLLDNKNRTILHHIALTSGMNGCSVAAKYYLDILLGWIVINNEKNAGSTNVNNDDAVSNSNNNIDDNDDKNSNNSSNNKSTDTNNKNNGNRDEDNSRNNTTDKNSATPIINDNDNNPTNSNIKKSDITLRWFIDNVLNAQDSSGDTCLNIASRLGNVAIVDALLDYGADPSIANNSGLRPLDFGAGTIAKKNTGNPKLSISSASSDTKINSINEYGSKNVNATIRNNNVPDTAPMMDSIQKLIDSINETYKGELKQHNDSVELLQKKLQDKRNELSELRKKISDFKSVKDKFFKLQEQITNLENGIADESQLFQNLTENFPELNDEDDSEIEFDADEPFKIGIIYDYISTVLNKEYDGDVEKLEQNLVDDTLRKYILDMLNKTDSKKTNEQLNHLPSKEVLNARIQAYEENEVYLQNTLQKIKEQQQALESKFKRVLSLCLKVDENKVDGMLDGLLQAITNEDLEDIDMNEMQNFLRKSSVDI